MQITALIDGEQVRADLRGALDVGIALQFGGAQPNAFFLPEATKRPVRAGDFIGDVAAGGAVNCFGVDLWPHGNGTHTETVGHIVSPAPSVHRTLRDTLVPAALISVDVTPLGRTEETYNDPCEAGDLVITAEALARAASALPIGRASAWWRALLVRTLPNDAGKRRATYSGENPVYMTHEAMRWVRELGPMHLLVDLPSVDREEDAGALLNHRIFWEVPPGRCGG